MKVSTDMIKLINNSLLLLVVSILSVFSCTNIRQKTAPKGYINSTAYKQSLMLDNAKSKEDKDEVINAEYSIKRMFMLLGEEEFLYNAEYNLYAVFMYIHSNYDTIDYYVLKSKDSIHCFTHKRLDSAGYFLYVNKDSNKERERYNLKTNVGLVDHNIIDSSSKIFKNVIALEEKGEKANPDYEDPIKTLFLFDGNEYHRIGNFNLNRMNEIDSFFTKVILKQ